MTSDWSLRDIILNLTHRWYLIAAFFLVGALLGWGVSKVLPPLYRAELDVYVGINAYRGPRDRYIVQVVQNELRKLDDYKNWQMEQLNGVAKTDIFLVNTLERLQDQDAYWGDTSIEDLSFQLRGSWRNAGRWHLSAEASQPDMAIQAVETWAEVIDERINEGTEYARELVALDASLVSVADELTNSLVRYQSLSQVKLDLEEASENLEEYQADEIWESYDHWRLISQVTRAADWDPGWGALIEAYPASLALPAEYSLWVERATSMVDADLEVLPGRIEYLEEQHDSLSAAYAEVAEKSLGLSAGLELEYSEDISPQVEDVRPSGLLMLVGGILGVLIWFLFVLVRFTNNGGDK
jgi:hypothetical protein